MKPLINNERTYYFVWPKKLPIVMNIFYTGENFQIFETVRSRSCDNVAVRETCGSSKEPQLKSGAINDNRIFNYMLRFMYIHKIPLNKASLTFHRSLPYVTNNILQFLNCYATDNLNSSNCHYYQHSVAN